MAVCFRINTSLQVKVLYQYVPQNTFFWANLRDTDEKYFTILLFDGTEVNFYRYLTVEMYTIMRGVSPQLNLIFQCSRVQLAFERSQFASERY